MSRRIRLVSRVLWAGRLLRVLISRGSLLLLIVWYSSILPAQENEVTPRPDRETNEQFIPADQLDAVFSRDRRGVMMKRDDFRALLEQARANAASSDVPVPIIAEQAELSVTPGEYQATVQLSLRVRQYASGWQTLRIPAGNLMVEKAEVDGEPALLARDPADPSALLLVHEQVGQFSVVVQMSTQLATLGSDRSAGFQLPVVPATMLSVNCPAGRHLLVNDLKLDRPAAEDQLADYVVPVGSASDVRLQWVAERSEAEAQTLVFTRTDAQLVIQKETLRWSSDSRISVFGGAINRIIARVPARLEVTSVESTGLESWTLDDDPENAGQTRITLTWRQPFTNDRVIHLQAVVPGNDGFMQSIPALQFADVTSHSGRLVITHEAGLRLVSEAGAGVRRISAGELDVSSDASVFEFWLQQFDLQVAAKPRDRELFAESSAVLAIDDTSAVFETTLTVETLNAPLFELPVLLPADWQLTSVAASDEAVPWTTGAELNQILVRPAKPVAPGQLLTLVLKLNRSIADPDTEQKLVLPVVSAGGVTRVGGTYRVRFGDDLTVVPLSLTGLVPATGTGTELVFQDPGTAVSGELSIVRRPSQLSVRSVLRVWADTRQQSLDAEIVTDVLSGTIRTLTLRLSEALGPDIRFEVRGVGLVPGLRQIREVRPVRIQEQSAGDVADGLRAFVLKLDERFAGSLTLHAFVQRGRTPGSPIAAPVVVVAGAVRQHGVLVFEASPEQQLIAGAEVRSIPGLFVADASLADAAAVSTGRRSALVFRFVRPGYVFQVREDRFATFPVPSAVCELVSNVCTLNDFGSVQRKCDAQIRASGVQTLRFRLPGGKKAMLWSTMLNGEPVEVRSDGDDFLVAVPAVADRQGLTLSVLFESMGEASSVFGRVEQGPVEFSIDVGERRALPIDVLRQSWRVHYPPSSLLLESDGQFRASAGVDEPGWLKSLMEVSLPESAVLLRRLFPVGVFFLILFVFTAMVSRRRWKSLAGLLVVGVVLLFLLLPASQLGREAARRSVSTGRFNRVDVAVPEVAAPMALSNMEGDGGFEADREVLLGDGAEMDAFSSRPLPRGVDGEGLGGFGGGRADFDVQINGLARQDELAGEAETFGRSALGAVSQVPPTSAEPSASVEMPGGAAGAPAVVPADPFPLAVDSPVSGVVAGGSSRGRRGTARLSVSVNLDVPDDYRCREFTSVADALAEPTLLSVVIQRERQIAAFRLIAVVVVCFWVWRIRAAALIWRLTVSAVFLLVALALLPLVSNSWQSALDGVACGALITAAVSVVCWCFMSWRRGVLWFWRRVVGGVSVVGVLVVLVLLGSWVPLAGAQLADVEQGVVQPDVVVPYDGDLPPLRADKVFIRHEDFLRLFQLARPGVLGAGVVNPLGSSVVSAFFSGGELRAVDGVSQVLRFDGRFVVWSDSVVPVRVPLPIGSVGIHSVRVDGGVGVVYPLLAGAETLQMPDFAGQLIPQEQKAQQVVAGNSAVPSVEGPAFAVVVSGRGVHVVDVAFSVAAVVEGDVGRADLPLRGAAAGVLNWTLPGDGLEAKVNGRSSVFRREGRSVVVPIAQLSTLRLQWLPALEKVDGGVVFHSSVVSAVAVEDSGVSVRTSVGVSVRQGEISDLTVSIPDGFVVQWVSGVDAAGWSVQNTDDSRAVDLQLRRSVNDSTSITLQLYASLPSAEELASLALPISMVRGASRDSGSVLLRTGSQFQVRSDSLSGVTQINPDEAAAPEGDELPGRPVLAWRYTRHPASVVVKITPSVDELVSESIHAVRLEEGRQLWSSRMSLQVSGTPRSRFDIVVPADFLMLDVSATGMKDWFFADGDGGGGDVRTLSIQLSDAWTGPLQVALLGQRPRVADRGGLQLRPPLLMHATKASSDLAVWLDAGSESAGIDSADGWTVRSTAALNDSYREIASSTPSLAFQSSAVQPGALSVRLRPAVSTLIGESVTLTNVTETALEVSLALNWQIARAAADHFAVDIPTPLAAIMSFDVPGLRKLTREDLGDGRSRVVFELQQPLTDRLFVLGTASVPVPVSGVISADVPAFVVPEGVAATLSGQEHFWVLVNQSGGLLQPSADISVDMVSADQIRTRLPAELLQQAVAVLKLRAGASPWSLVYPDEHQVSPAVVTLASHTTVISDDGSWRSRHELVVTNESRQFLPVVLPEGSRMLYCLVEGRPSRVVVGGDGNDERSLIPIPQSGLLATGFRVEFALSGRFSESAASVRESWQTQRLSIPVPVFPEFREDSEMGISVSRNRWSVYVPVSWRATLVNDPVLTNVVSAVSDELEDAVLLSDVEQAVSLLKNAKAAKSDAFRQRALAELQSAQSRLRRFSGKASGAEQQRGEVLSKLGDLAAEFAGQQIAPLSPVELQQSAGYLFEQDLNLNRLNAAQYDSILQDNRGAGLLGGQAQGQSIGDASFRFGISFPDPERSGAKEESKKAAGKRLAPSKGERSESELRESKDQKATEADGKADAGSGFNAGRSQLLQRRSDLNAAPQLMVDAAKAGDVSDLLQDQLPGNVPSPEQPQQVEFEAVPQMAIGQQAAQSDEFGFQAGALGRGAVPTGLLSLQFEVPTDGTRIDFLRVGGNPSLSLDVQSSNTVSKKTGVVWLVLCGAAALLLLSPGRKGEVFVFCQRLFLIVAIAGLVAWIFGGEELNAIGLLCCVSGSVALAVTVSIASLQRTR